MLHSLYAWNCIFPQIDSTSYRRKPCISSSWSYVQDLHCVEVILVHGQICIFIDKDTTYSQWSYGIVQLLVSIWAPSPWWNFFLFLFHLHTLSQSHGSQYLLNWLQALTVFSRRTCWAKFQSAFFECTSNRNYVNNRIYLSSHAFYKIHDSPQSLNCLINFLDINIYPSTNRIIPIFAKEIQLNVFH